MTNILIMGLEAIVCYLLYSRLQGVQLNNHKRIRKNMRNPNKRKRK